MDEIDKRIFRIRYLFKRDLLVDMLLEIIAPDIVFLSDIEYAISWEPALRIREIVQVYLGDRCDRNERSGIMQ